MIVKLPDSCQPLQELTVLVFTQSSFHCIDRILRCLLESRDLSIDISLCLLKHLILVRIDVSYCGITLGVEAVDCSSAIGVELVDCLLGALIELADRFIASLSHTVCCCLHILLLFIDSSNCFICSSAHTRCIRADAPLSGRGSRVYRAHIRSNVLLSFSCCLADLIDVALKLLSKHSPLCNVVLSNDLVIDGVGDDDAEGLSRLNHCRVRAVTVLESEVRTGDDAGLHKRL